MKEMQCSEAESNANHPAFSAPDLTRHRAACCVVALAFLLSNLRWLSKYWLSNRLSPSNIGFQIGCHTPSLSSCFYWVVIGDERAPQGTNSELSTCPNA
jgi:hypothetical protein